ncbi:hypothetical protein [Actinokineospora cianjurensis]|uniref:Prenyltransferase/squalene oxidase-like repeat protein n=1 Tax=Actinokineospora cianjurensis TaxID=585224 RepID=A0A421B264_9PSEU|nr:hypothetical protein [Actinokineospora cianjurensis]RLK58526.1 hypothetical protein CLV68_2993 [Actinokineospora cianjurensis]
MTGALSKGLRRVAAVVAVAALVTAGVATVAAADADRTAAKSNSHWLARQLAADGTIENPLGGSLPDHGLMIDILLAGYASGNGALVEPIVTYLDDEKFANDYFTWDGLLPDMGYDAIIRGGQTAKTLVAAEVSGRNPRDFGGYDMVAETKASIARSGPHKGRISDYSKNPEWSEMVSNEANMFGQSLGVIGLAGVGENDQLAIDRLLTQQCSDGYFRIFFGVIPTAQTPEQDEDVLPNGYKFSTCDEGEPYDQSSPDGDTTGLALSALLAARHAGAPDLDDPIERAVAWLKQNQASSGGWSGGVGTETPNANSTGLITQALADAGGADAEVAKGVRFLKSAQVTAADKDTPIAGELGGIAYTPAGYDSARRNGIGSDLPTWIRASAQASLGLSQVGFYDLTKGNIPDGGEEPTSPSTTPTPTSTTTPAPTTTPDVTTPNVTTTEQTTSTTVAPETRTETVTAAQRPRTRTPRPVSSRAGAQAPPPATAPRTDVIPVVPPPVETPASTPAAKLAAFLAGRLVDGDHIEVNQDGRSFVDYDATADLVFGLRALGGQDDAVQQATLFLLNADSVKAYAHGAPYEKADAAYAEPLAKLQLLGRFLKADGGAPADVDKTVSDLAISLNALREPDGTYVDTGAQGDASQSTERHVWVTLAAIADNDGTAALGALLGRQCRDGTFPVDLSIQGCGSGDLAATAKAVVALNAAPHKAGTPNGTESTSAEPSTSPESTSPESTPSEPSSSSVAPAGGAKGPAIPTGWSTKRLDGLVAAAGALNAKVTPEGVVLDGNAGTDTVLSAVVASGRQAAGLDVKSTAATLGSLLHPDGGMPKLPDGESELVTSIAVAQGVAGTSWVGLDTAPIAPVLRLPTVASVKTDTAERARAAGVANTTAVWVVGIGALLLVAAIVGSRQITRRNTTRKAVSP